MNPNNNTMCDPNNNTMRGGQVAKNPHLCCCDSLLEFLELAPNSNLQANPISYSNDVEGSPR